MPSSVRRRGVLVFLLALSVYAATTGGSMATDIMSYEVTKGIVESGTVAMSHNVFQMDAHRGVDGRYYAPYGIGHAAYSIPFYVAARAVERWDGLGVAKAEALRKAGFVMGSAVAAALTVWVAFLFAWRLSSNERAAVQTALTLGFATLLWPYAKFGFSAPLGALCVMCGTYGAWVGIRSNRRAMLVLGGAGFGCALFVKHELVLLCLPVGLWMAAESGWNVRRTVRRALFAGGPVVAAAIVTLYYNYTRFGNPLDTGYLRDSTVERGSFFVGLAGLLFSPGASFFLYSPALVAGVAALATTLARRDRRTAALFVGEWLVLVCFYATFAHWDGERSYGPRYLVPVIPILVLPLAGWFASEENRIRRRLLGGLVALSVLVQLPGILVDFSKVGYTPQVGHPAWAERQWTWKASALRLNGGAALSAVADNVRYVVTAERPPLKAPQGEARDFSEQFAFSLDFWWLYLFYLRAVSAPVAVLLGASCLVAAAFFASRLWRTTNRVSHS